MKKSKSDEESSFQLLLLPLIFTKEQRKKLKSVTDVSLNLIALSWAIVFVLIIKTLISGWTIFLVFGGLVGIFCGKKCSELALEMKKSVNVAYTIGFLFGVFALIFYWYWNIMKTAYK